MHTDTHPSPTEAFCCAPTASAGPLRLAADGILFFFFFFVIAVNEVPSEAASRAKRWKSCWAPFRVITVPLFHCVTPNHSRLVILMDYKHRFTGSKA